ncbi:MAG: hypothetical protein ABGX83_08005 [Nitrospira sp.]|nr:hypothetical protein [Candidatus Manganitrophaceae bacterium]HIL34138.1 hypothetical protein [Candidatus Manganitrophaceae bacterium]
MINLILVFGIGIPAAFVLVNFILFRTYTAFNLRYTGEFREITADWQNFMERGIPVPTDYVRIEQPFEAQPVLIQPNFEIEKVETAV